MQTILHIGLDDTDSPKRGCTTYVAAVLAELLEKAGCAFLDYPNLIRLNPNIPWKTRGNGTLSLRVTCASGDLDQVKRRVVNTVRRLSDIGAEGTDPAVTFLTGEVPEALTAFSLRAIRTVIPLDEAEQVAQEARVEVHLLKGRRGLVGAVAALGDVLRGDHTFELITYRTPDRWGTPRQVDIESIKQMDRQTAPLTFNNFDYEANRPLITPHGPDPILYGIRAENLHALLKAKDLVKTHEPIERWSIFRTNHGTDMHLAEIDRLSQLKPYTPAIATGLVSYPPKVIPGRHVIFGLHDGTGEVDCAAFEPTGAFRNVVKQLIPNDRVQVFGGVKPPAHLLPTTINLEKLRILELAQQRRLVNPLCPVCGRRTESAGRSQGFRCRRCRSKPPRNEKTMSVAERGLKEGLYIPPPRANRHLTKPSSRYGQEKNGLDPALIPRWHDP